MICRTAMLLCRSSEALVGLFVTRGPVVFVYVHMCYILLVYYFTYACMERCTWYTYVLYPCIYIHEWACMHAECNSFCRVINSFCRVYTYVYAIASSTLGIMHTSAVRYESQRYRACWNSNSDGDSARCLAAAPA